MSAMAFSSLAVSIQGCPPRVHPQKKCWKGAATEPEMDHQYFETPLWKGRNQRLTKTYKNQMVKDQMMPSQFPILQRLTSFFHHFCLVHMGMAQNWGSLWSHSVGQCWRARDGEEYDLLCV